MEAHSRDRMPNLSQIAYLDQLQNLTLVKVRNPALPQVPNQARVQLPSREAIWSLIKYLPANQADRAHCHNIAQNVLSLCAGASGQHRGERNVKAGKSPEPGDS